MSIRKCVLAFCTLAACLLLWSCTALPPPAAAEAGSGTGIQPPHTLAHIYAQLQGSQGRVMRLDPAASRIRIYVFRGGRSAGLGHNHVLSAPQFEGYAYVPEQGLAEARLDLLFRLDQLVFDVAAHRLEAGPAFAAVLSDAAIAATREHMLADENMQAERYPLVHIHALGISGEAPRLSARLAITMHGQTRELNVPLSVTGLPQGLNVSGSFALRQSDFGIQPYSVMGGLLAVQDDVRLEFSLVGAPL